MAPLHAATTLPAAADGDQELAHRRPDDRHVDLPLPRGVGGPDRTRTVRTGRGQRHADRFVDARRLWPRRTTTIRPAGFAARAFGLGDRCAFRERRRLALRRAPRRLELRFQAFVLAPEPIPLALEPLILTAQPGDFAVLLCDDSLGIVGGG